MMLAKHSLSEQVEEAIRGQILDGQLALGARIDTVALQQKWQISVTPIRDALLRLSAAGLVTVTPRRGFFVAVPDRQLLKDVFELRMSLEHLAIASSAEVVDVAEIECCIQQTKDGLRALDDAGDLQPLISVDALVHDLVLKHSGNRKLVEVMTQLGDLIALTRTLITLDRRSYEHAAAEHLAIFNALLQRDVERAQQAMHSHLKNSFQRAMSVWAGIDGGVRSLESGDLREPLPRRASSGRRGARSRDNTLPVEGVARRIAGLDATRSVELEGGSEDR